jgi:hypothetical protein
MVPPCDMKEAMPGAEEVRQNIDGTKPAGPRLPDNEVHHEKNCGSGDEGVRDQA